MKFIIRLLKFLFGLLAGTVFVLSFFIVIPCYFFIFTFASKEKSPRIAHWLSQRWAKIILTVFFIKVDISNQEFIDPDKTYVFIANHCSQLDIPVYAVSCKNTLRFLAKIELTKIPLMGYIIRKLYISVDRKNKEARLKSMQNMMNSLHEGISVFICPEGTRNRTEKPLLEFHEGAFRLAIESQLPIAALTVKNSSLHLSPSHTLELSPGTIYCEWSKPIETKGMTKDDIPRLKEMAAKQMMENLK